MSKSLHNDSQSALDGTKNCSEEQQNPSTTPKFVEFCDELGETMNNGQVISIVAANNEELLKFEGLLNGVLSELSTAPKLGALPRVSFTGSDNVEKFEDCTAVHEKTPLIAVVDMLEDASFICSMRGLTCEARMKNDIKNFIQKFEVNEVSKAKQGARRPHNDASIQYPHLKVAVQCSFKDLVHDQPGDCLVILFSHQCPCCPEALRCMDAFIAAVEDQDSSFKMRAVCCNIEENELDSPDWPINTDDQFVPMIKLYVNCSEAPEGHPCGGADATGTRKTFFTFKGIRNCENYLNFILEHATSPPPACFDKKCAIECWEQCKMKRKREEH